MPPLRPTLPRPDHDPDLRAYSEDVWRRWREAEAAERRDHPERSVDDREQQGRANG